MNEEFGRTMQAQMAHFNGPSGDSLATVNAKLDDVKNVMVQNIEVRVLETSTNACVQNETENSFLNPKAQ